MIECKCIYKVCVCKPVVNEAPKDKRYHWWKDKDMGENIDNWEEVPKEELWQDGEVDDEEVAWEMFKRVCEDGDWLLIRRIEDGEN
jgi:hypothetical protein